jgi:ADP-dependent NAD(P)H-hydrate dehydratase / NAD(P)H-hydrate epimerase
MHELLTTEEMAEADRRAVAMGVPSLTLMENAGRAVADEAAKMVAAGAKIAVLCGPGNNGGDGFVAARILKERGFDVRVACLVPVADLKGDAAVMAGKCSVPVTADAAQTLLNAQLIIDALFGAGLTRPLEGSAAAYVAGMKGSGAAILSVDVPSGVDGNTGIANGPVVQATRTITFFRKKPGHLLMPGRAWCGQVVVADIGIPDEVLNRPLSPSVPWTERGEGWGEGRHTFEQAAAPHPNPLPVRTGRGDARTGIATFENTLELWCSAIPRAKQDAHKYTRGHAVVVSGPPFQTGAARLAARGALRMGAGLVTVAGSSSATAVNAAHLTAIMLAVCNRAQDLREILEDKRKNAVLIGPGGGVGQETRDLVEVALASGAAVVLDADAMTSFAEANEGTKETANFGFTSSRTKAVTSPAALFAAIHAKPDRPVVMTPHEGEFKRLFPDLAKLPSKLDRAREAAKISGAVVVLKGADTVIASPNGEASISANAPPTLATAGSGDVLAGFIAGLSAQGMPAFHAACASVWLHGECANVFGAGLIAEDLPEVLPQVLAKLIQASTSD